MEIILKQELKLSAKTLRCADLSGYFLLVGSFSKQVYLLVESNGTYELSRTFDLFESEVYSVKFLSNSTFAVGCKNGTIYVMDLEGEIIHVLSQSSSTVSGLDCSANYLASGHWDGTCIIWSLETFEKIKTLEEHKFAVVCKFLHNGNLVTGSQTGELNLWNGVSFNKMNSVQAHADIIRAIDSVSHHVITCSNDGHIKIWDEHLKEVIGQNLHSSFIYNIAHYRETGQGMAIISGGEDFKLVVSINLKEVASIPYPTTIWRIVANEKAHEFIVFGDDGFLRVFTTDKSRVVNLEAHANFISSAEIASLKNPEISPDDLAKFPPKSKLTTMVGKKEGEVKVFNNNGKGEAYCWQKGKWEYLGEMVGANGTMGKRNYEGDKFFPAGDYDFIFDIQDDSGKTRLLPFNRGDNPLEATEKFIAREQISIAFKEQILNFVIKNTKGSNPDPKANASNLPVNNQQTNLNQARLQKFPVIDYIFFFTINVDALRNKFLELNNQLDAETSKHKKLIKTELTHFDSLLKKLSVANEMHTTTLTDMELALVENKLLKWTDENDIPVLDLMRVFVMHHDASRILNSVDSGLKVALFAITFAKYDQEKFFILIIKLMSNLFKNNPQTFFKADPIIRDFLSLKGSKFTPKVTSAYFSLVGNLVSNLIENQKSFDFIYLLEFLLTCDLGFVLSSEQESTNLLILLGNALSSGNPEIVRLVGQSPLKPVLDQMPFNPHGMLEDIRQYLLKA
jgi:phospholipase A-2-activating protein